MTEKPDIEAFAERAAEKAIERVFERMGIDTSDPKATIEIQRDFAFLRSIRNGASQVSIKALAMLAAMFLAAVLGTVYAVVVRAINHQ